jgi:GDP-L-fucose synthase
MIGNLMGYRGSFVFNADKPNGQPRRCLDVSRARERFGFVARTTLEDGLATTIEWWRSKNPVG